jgi:ATP-dependent DNA ligase
MPEGGTPVASTREPGGRRARLPPGSWRAHRTKVLPPATCDASATLITVVVVPSPLVPMVPTLVRSPFHRDGWVYEEKVDGWRMRAYKEGARIR